MHVFAGWTSTIDEALPVTRFVVFGRPPRQLLDAHGTGASGFQPSTAAPAGTSRSQLACCSGRDGLDLDMDMGQPRRWYADCYV